MELTQEYIKSIFNYNKKTGKLIWKKATRNVPKGKEAGTLEHRGYYRIQLKGVSYKAHRLVWLFNYGVLPTLTIDHINHDKEDNRIENLREVSHKENSRNQKRRYTNTSGYNGVTWCKRDKKWKAQIKYEGRNIFLGRFKEIQYAVLARKEADVKYKFHTNHGEEYPYDIQKKSAENLYKRYEDETR